jgi:glycosyltransferase involved in cell wall biosynthesis
MVNPPKASVLIPVYNGERYLPECLESVLAQNFTDMEILIADDGSCDGSSKIIAHFAARDPRIRWWRNSRNLGLTANANACLREAAGEYIKFVHQDDVLLSPSTVRRMVAALDKNPSAVLAGSEPHVTGAKSRPIILSKKNGLYTGKEMIIACFEQNNNLIGQPTLTLFRKSAAGRGFDEHFTGCMDYEMWCHLLEQGDFLYLAEPLATWRVHQNQQTARARVNGMSDHESLRLIEMYYTKPWLRAAATDRLLFAQIYYLRKSHGEAAEALTRAMMTELAAHRYLWHWMQHKISKPIRQIARKLERR